MWDRLEELKRVILSCEIDHATICGECDFELQLARQLFLWIDAAHLPVDLLYYHKDEGKKRGLPVSRRSPYPIVCLGGSSWPDIGICNRKDLASSLSVDDYLVAIELKIVGKKHSPAEDREWIWNGIGQTLVNSLGYHHSLFVALDFRPTITEAEAELATIAAVESSGSISVILRRVHV